MKKLYTLSYFVVFFIFMTGFGFCEEMISVSKTEGSVFYLKKNSFMKKAAKKEMNLFSGDLIITAENSHAVINLCDGSSVIVDENSNFKIINKSNFEQEGGKAYYTIAKKEQKGIEVKTPFAVIGVKGTEFIVNSNKENQGIALKKGLLNIESLNDQFELRRKNELSAFESFMEKTKSAFTDYKVKQDKEFVEFVDNFELKPDKMVSFSNNIVNEDELSKELDKEFEKFRSLL